MQCYNKNGGTHGSDASTTTVLLITGINLSAVGLIVGERVGDRVGVKVGDRVGLNVGCSVRSSSGDKV